MGFKEWFGFGGSAAAEAPQDAEEPQVEQESPEAASKRLAAEEAAEAEGPELKVVEAEEEPKVSEASRAELWSDMTEANTQRANDLFDKANKYFRDKKKETGSGKWDKADPRYLSWQAGVAQISASELLGKHAVRLEELQAQKESLDKISLTASERKKKGGSFEESMEAIDQLAKVNAELALEQAIVEQLDTAYQEQELDIARMEFDIVAQVENDAAKKAEQAGYAAAIDKAKEAGFDVLYGDSITRIFIQLQKHNGNNKP